MTDAANRVLDAAMQLSEAERAEIAEILMDSISGGFADEDIKAAWVAEAKRRLAAFERGETTLVDADEMIDRLRSKVRSTRPRRTSAG